jgi:hypothetical protein
MQADSKWLLNNKILVSFAMVIILGPSRNNMQGTFRDANPRKCVVELLVLLNRMRQSETDESRCV